MSRGITCNLETEHAAQIAQAGIAGLADEQAVEAKGSSAGENIDVDTAKAPFRLDGDSRSQAD
jgi:hypothetical protein